MNPETKWCNRCEKDLPVSEFVVNKGKARGLSTYCRPHMLAAQMESHWKRRLAFLAEMGGCCVTCGFSDYRALQVDHVNGGGQEEARRMGASTTSRFYAHVLAHRDQYQLLCANCNTIKRLVNGESTGPRGLRSQ